MNRKNFSCIKYFVLINFIFLIMGSCKNQIKQVKKATKKSVLELDSSSINRLNNIFEGFVFLGTKYKFNRGNLFKYPKFNNKFISYTDTANLVFFKLHCEKKDTNIVIAINKRWCNACLVLQFNGYLYPCVNIIFPNNFSFLNQEGFPKKFTCSNSDPIKLRRIGYNKRMQGTWYVDSVNKVVDNIKNIISLNKILINKNNVVLNDTLKCNYKYQGFEFTIKNSKLSFFQLLANKKHMILINTFNNSKIEYYLSKNSASLSSHKN